MPYAPLVQTSLPFPEPLVTTDLFLVCIVLTFPDVRQLESYHVFLFSGCCKKRTQMGWLKEQSFLSQFWQPEVQYQGVRRAVFPLEALREESCLPLPVLSSGWQSLVVLGSQLQHSNLYLCQHVASTLCVCDCVSSSYKDTSHVGLGLALFQHDFILTTCIRNDCVSIKVTF